MPSVACRIVRVANALGAHVAKRWPPAPFELEESLEDARRETGLDDFGGDSFQEPLARLIDALEREAQLSVLGRIIAARARIHGHLVNRLRITADRRRDPSIAEERIRAPFVIIGPPRTGTSILFRTLAQDERALSALAWQLQFPSPPPERTPRSIDRRFLRVRANEIFLNGVIPDLRKVYETKAELPEECVVLKGHEFTTIMFSIAYSVPSYERWLLGCDQAAAYDWHERVLQQLQWNSGGGRWVLKSPEHLLSLDRLLAKYPDACIIQTHRDPLEIVPSLASLTRVLRSLSSDAIDEAAIGREASRFWAEALERGLAYREAHPELADRFLDAEESPEPMNGSHNRELIAPLNLGQGRVMTRYSLRVLFALAISALPIPAIGADGSLRVRPSGPSACPSGNAFFEGQTVDVFGSGFSSGATVDIFYGVNDQNLALIATATANSSGALDTSVVVPTGPSTPAVGAMEARGQMPDGERLYLGTLLQIAGSLGPDSDGDLVPDLCDNCSNTPNSGQENSDRDALGSACDPCPLDADNDADGDSLCSDADECPFDPDNDVDGDDRCGDDDNCPTAANSNQLDSDENGIGDACQTTPTCSDGIDNDRDGFTDSPADGGCSDANDTSETASNLPCDDGVDNDGDALSDYHLTGGGDPGCSSDTSLPENPQCDDGIDNDGDGKVDWDGDFSLHPSDPQCLGLGWFSSELGSGGGGC